MRKNEGIFVRDFSHAVNFGLGTSVTLWCQEVRSAMSFTKPPPTTSAASRRNIELNNPIATLKEVPNAFRIFCNVYGVDCDGDVMNSKAFLDDTAIMIMDREIDQNKAAFPRAVKISKVGALQIEYVVVHMIGLCNLWGEREQVFIRVKKVECHSLRS